METMVLERMIDQYQNLIFSICYRIVGDYFEAQDLTQETFLAAYRNLDSFDGANEKAWLTRIATNKSLDYKKQAARRLIPTEDTSLNAITDSWSDGSSPPETHYMEKEVRRQLYQTCSSLKPPYNEIALEYFYQERTVEEIAKKHGKNKKTIQTQVYRARDLLRKHYRKEADAV